ncbi:MAG: hypothetical protein J6A16_04895, partial [Oscillospiraceae bacterium]|nr:hypothetical protein [Oscillospiraceae bacterium]
INYVFGHTGTFIWNPMSSPSIWHEKNLIGIDCGCAVKQGFQHPMIGMVKGRLGCIRLEDMKCFYSEEKRKSTKGSIVSAFAH